MWDLTQQEPKQIKLIDGVIPAVKDKEYVGNSKLDLWQSLISGVAHTNLLMIALLSGTHLVNTLSSRLVLMVRDPFFRRLLLCSDWGFQILSLSLVTPGPRRLLSAAASQLVISMQSRYLRMVYTWPHQRTRMCIFGQLKHEGYSTRRS